MLLSEVADRKRLTDMVVREFLVKRLDFSVEYSLVSVGVRFPDFVSGVFETSVEELVKKVGLFGDYGLDSVILELELTYEIDSTRFSVTRHGSAEVAELVRYIEHVSHDFLQYYIEGAKTMVFRSGEDKVRLSIFINN